MNRGFTLIELLIVLAIIGILGGIAYPHYQEHVTSARRHDGQLTLLDLANRLEWYYLEHHTYQTASIGTGTKTDIRSSTISPEGWYTLVIRTQTDNSYTLEAIPRNSQASADTQCQTLTYNHLGTKGIITGPVGTPNSSLDRCWS